MKKKRKFRVFFYSFALTFLGALFIIYLIIENNVQPTLKKIAEVRAHSIAFDAINQTVEDDVIQRIKYDKLYSIKTNDQGRVVMMQPNTPEINRLMIFSAKQIQKSLDNLQKEQIRIPMGQIMGSKMFADMGPTINVTVVPFGIVNTDISDKFQQAGINQIRHVVSMQVEAKVKFIIPFMISSDEKVRTTVPIAEAIILGDVPQYYLNIDKGIAKESL